MTAQKSAKKHVNMKQLKPKTIQKAAARKDKLPSIENKKSDGYDCRSFYLETFMIINSVLLFS